MSYVISGTPTSLLTDKQKQERVPDVIQALAKKFGWFVAVDAGWLRIRTEEKTRGYDQVTYNPATCTFSGDEDYGGVRAILGQILGPISLRRANAFSDTYEMVDAAVAVEQLQGWSWEWADNNTIMIDDSGIKLGAF